MNYVREDPPEDQRQAPCDTRIADRASATFTSPHLAFHRTLPTHAAKLRTSSCASSLSTV